MPTGGSGGQFNNLTTYAGIANSVAGSIKIRGLPYRLSYAGSIANGALNGDISGASWWPRTAYSSEHAYNLGVGATYVIPGNHDYRYVGCSLRCIATATS